MAAALVCLLVVCAVAAPVPRVHAGALYLQEFGTPSMGVAGAGAQAIARDASTAFHNPAGMTRLDDHQFMATAGMFYSDVKFDPDDDTPIPGGSGGNQGGPGPILGAFYTHSLSDRWKVGANLISVSGAILDPDDDWAGRFQLQEVELFTLSFNPTIAYRVSDWLSVGAGAVLMYGRLDMDVAAPLPPAIGGEGRVKLDDLDDFEPGFDVGVLFEVSPRTRIGVAYLSEIELNLDGDVKLQPLGLQAGIDTRLPFVQTVRAGLYHELTDWFTLLVSVAWEDWSTFNNQFVPVSRVSTEIRRRWNDTWHVGLGAQYWLDDRWMLQSGVAYDSSPVDSDDRMSDLPMDQQIRVALGVQHHWSDRVKVGAAFTYADYGGAIIGTSLLRGHYERNQIFFLAFNVNWGGLWGSG
jgi:long-chain fatty acid transport protein